MALLTGTALGQSLSILRKGESEFWIEAAAPADARYLLQASGNLHLWVDLHDEVTGQISHRFEGADVSKCFFRLTPWTAPAPPITIVLLGDSTVADFVINSSLFNGWGQGVYGYFKPNVRVVNLAYPGCSTKVFLASDQWINMRAIRPDVVLAQFGLFDQDGDPGIQRTTFEEFANNLKTIVETVRGFQGIPILMTPPVQNLFDSQGKVVPRFAERYAVLKNVVIELQTHLIDLQQLSMDLLNELGPSRGSYIFWGGTNFGHFSDPGAQVIAGLVVNALPDRLGPFLLGNIFQRPKPYPHGRLVLFQRSRVDEFSHSRLPVALAVRRQRVRLWKRGRSERPAQSAVRPSDCRDRLGARLAADL